MGGCFSSDEWQVVVKEERDVVYSKLLFFYLKICNSHTGSKIYKCQEMIY